MAAWLVPGVGPAVCDRAMLPPPGPGTSAGPPPANLEAMEAAYDGGGDMA